MSNLVFVEARPMAGRVVPISPSMTVGREGTDVVLTDPEVSRRHAQIGDWEGQPTIEDLGSLNGTWVNGHRLEQMVRLSPGDEVRFGQTVWRLEVAAATTRPHDVHAG